MITKPKGTQDIYGLEGKKWEYVNSIINDFCRLYNYEYIRTPVFENSELFHRSVGTSSDLITKETYDFQDRHNRNLTLRPEGTAGIVRAFIENKMYANNTDPVKVYYNQTMYRYERPQAGRYRELTQFGIEVLGGSDPIIDAEVISMPYRLFEELGIDNVTVNINTLGDKESRENYKKILVDYLTPHINELCSDCQNRLKVNPLRILDCKVDKDNEILKNAPKIIDNLNEESKNRFNKVLKYLRLMDIDYEINQNIVRGLDYYDHTVFEYIVDIPQMENLALGGGGRYNELVEQLDGPSTSCIGFGCGIERIILAMEHLDLFKDFTPNIDCYVMYVNEEEKLKALDIVQTLRLNGLTTETNMNNKSLKAQFKAADKYGAQQLIILNSDDLFKGLVTVKDNLTKEEQKIDEYELVDYLISNI